MKTFKELREGKKESVAQAKAFLNLLKKYKVKDYKDLGKDKAKFDKEMEQFK